MFKGRGCVNGIQLDRPLGFDVRQSPMVELINLEWQQQMVVRCGATLFCQNVCCSIVQSDTGVFFFSSPIVGERMKEQQQRRDMMDGEWAEWIDGRRARRLDAENWERGVCAREGIV